MSTLPRSCLLLAGASALVCAQAAYAAPAPTRSALDPLVSLSVLGTAQSRAAVCAGAIAAASAAEGQSVPGTGCVLPVTAAPPAPIAEAPMAEGPLAAAPMVHSGFGIGPLAFLAGVAAIVGIAGYLLTRGNHHHNQPISPA